MPGGPLFLPVGRLRVGREMGLKTPENRVLIDGLPIDIDDPEAVLESIGEAIEQRSSGHYISITNTELMYHGHRSEDLGAYIRGCDFSLCDGVGVIVAGRAHGRRVRRFNGPILQLECSRYGASRGWRHYYLGGADGSAAEMGERLKAAYPGLLICGMYEPPFRPLTAEERDAMIADIEAAKPDILWVGLGLPKQERMITSLMGELKVPWMVGVGAAFDYHSGRVPWAPALLRRIGAEWLFRLIIQPRIRAKRYWWSGLWMISAIGRGLAGRLGARPERRA